MKKSTLQHSSRAERVSQSQTGKHRALAGNGDVDSSLPGAGPLQDTGALALPVVLTGTVSPFSRMSLHPLSPDGHPHDACPQICAGLTFKVLHREKVCAKPGGKYLTKSLMVIGWDCLADEDRARALVEQERHCHPAQTAGGGGESALPPRDTQCDWDVSSETQLKQRRMKLCSRSLARPPRVTEAEAPRLSAPVLRLLLLRFYYGQDSPANLA